MRAPKSIRETKEKVALIKVAELRREAEIYRVRAEEVDERVAKSVRQLIEEREEQIVELEGTQRVLNQAISKLISNLSVLRRERLEKRIVAKTNSSRRTKIRTKSKGNKNSSRKTKKTRRNV